jgi:hypothetical protein
MIRTLAEPTTLRKVLIEMSRFLPGQEGVSIEAS